MSTNLDVFAKGWKEAHANMGESEPTPHRQGTETGKEIWDPLCEETALTTEPVCCPVKNAS